MANIGVLGAGSWGTALSVLLHDNGNQATIWSIDPAEIEMLSKEREHKTKLPGVHSKRLEFLRLTSVWIRWTERSIRN